MNKSMIQGFLECSAELTGFSVFDLRGTGETEAYFDTCTSMVGDEVLAELLQAWGKLDEKGEARSGAIRRAILGDPKLGPIARSIIKLWFSGTWCALPRAWEDAYGMLRENTTFAVRPSSYPEGLLWKTIGANPPGAKAPGYGSWAEPPRIPDPDQGNTVLKLQTK